MVVVDEDFAEDFAFDFDFEEDFGAVRFRFGRRDDDRLVRKMMVYCSMKEG